MITNVTTQYIIARKEAVFNVFETNDIDDTGFIDPLNDLDPNKHYFKELGFYTVCKYYLEAGYSKKLHSLNISKDNCSFIHLNIRTVMENMSQFYNYLQNIHHTFTFIGLSETWNDLIVFQTDFESIFIK